jgi:hypothetical protein
MHQLDDWLRADPSGRYAMTRVRTAELQAEAARERLARSEGSARPAPAGRPGLRTRLGEWFIRFGAALAQGQEQTTR